MKVSTPLFFIALGLTRLLRFGGEAVLAYFYGQQIIGWLKSDIFEYITIFLISIALLGTVITVVGLVRKTRAGRRPAQRHAA